MMSKNNLSLWQIKNEHEQLLNQLYDIETGEVNQEIQKKLNELIPNVEEKCIAVASWIRKMESEEIELDRLLHEVECRRKAYTKEIERYVSYLKSNMEHLGISEIKCPYFTLKIKKNPYSTDIIDQNEIPEKYLRKIVKTEIKPNKQLIKDDVLMTGEQIPGAIVQQNTKLEILISKI